MPGSCLGLKSGENNGISTVSLLSRSFARSMNVRRVRGKGQSGMAKSITIYGIKNCDTMKKARAWLDSHGVAYSFHDYKSEGIAKDKLKVWSDEVGWETLLNRAGTTFRKLADSDREGLNE